MRSERSNEHESSLKSKVRHPKMYAVILWNDDDTSEDFVLEVLKYIFNKAEADALSLIENIEKDGRGKAGVYSRDIAYTKRDESLAYAHECEFEQFKVTVEPLIDDEKEGDL